MASNLSVFTQALEDFVRNVVREEARSALQTILLGTPAVSKAAAPIVAPTAKKKAVKKANIKPCRHPGCKKPSKGPRFHYLCEDHRGVKKEEAPPLKKAAPKKAGAKKGKEKK